MFEQISMYDLPSAAGFQLFSDGAAWESKRGFLEVNLWCRVQTRPLGKKRLYETECVAWSPTNAPSCPSPWQRRTVLSSWRQRDIPCPDVYVVEYLLLFLPNYSHVPSVEGSCRLGEASLARHLFLWALPSPVGRGRWGSRECLLAEMLFFFFLQGIAWDKLFSRTRLIVWCLLHMLCDCLWFSPHSSSLCTQSSSPGVHSGSFQEGMALPRLPSDDRLEISKCWAWVTFLGTAVSSPVFRSQSSLSSSYQASEVSFSGLLLFPGLGEGTNRSLSSCLDLKFRFVLCLGKTC